LNQSLIECHVHSCFAILLLDVIICQSVVRRFSAMKRVKVLRQEHERVRALLVTACATVIQRSWKESRFGKVKSNMLRIKRTELSSATKIARTWRRFVCQEEYRRTAIGM
jgi:hypothetical protein